MKESRRKRTALEIIGILAITTVAVVFAKDIISLARRIRERRLDINKTAQKQVLSKKQRRKEMVETTIRRNIGIFEEKMVERGAVLRDEFDVDNREKFELRPIYEYKGNFFRIGVLLFEDEGDPYIVVNAIDNERFAKIGIMEEIEAYPYDIPEYRIDEVVGEFLEAEL